MVGPGRRNQATDRIRKDHKGKHRAGKVIPFKREKTWAVLKD
jgi:hypothetical protein